METLCGTVRSVKAFDSGYVIARLDSDQLAEPVTVVGQLPRLSAGEAVEVLGEWTQHPSYGRQFKASSAVSAPLTSETGLIRFLGGGLLPGVGEGTARKIVAHFGADSLRVLDEEPARLREVPGLGPKKAASITTAWAERQAERAVLIWLGSHGATTNLGLRVFKAFGPRSIAAVTADPYVLEREVPGVGFLTADRIARALGVPADSGERVAAGLSYVLEQAAQEGHVHLPWHALVTAAAQVLGVDENHADDMLHIRLARPGTAGGDSRLVAETLAGERVVYLDHYWTAETTLAANLRRVAAGQGSRFWALRRYDIPALVARHAPSLTPEQAAGVVAALTTPLTVLTGGPGTGKTFCVRTAAELAQAAGLTVVLAAPTGRAAQRLSEVTGQPAATLHRLLEVQPQAGLLRFNRNEHNPLTADLIIVDEASMLDTQLADHLLRAVGLGAHLLFVGDVDQLPAVGPGNVLADLIGACETGALAGQVVRLGSIFRQAAGSHIIQNAHRVRWGQHPVAPPAGTPSDFYFVNQPDPARATDLVVELVSRRIPAAFGIPPAQIQVLAPMHHGGAGVTVLNRRLQAALNPPRGQAEFMRGDRIFRTGDRVMQTQNDYDRGVFNGDMGEIVAVDPARRSVAVRFGTLTVPYDTGDLDALVHAWACTVHKSQGSEFSAVVLVQLKAHSHMLARNLLYTALTRGQKLVVLVGAPEAVHLAVANTRAPVRHSGLAARLALEVAPASSAPAPARHVGAAAGAYWAPDGDD